MKYPKNNYVPYLELKIKPDDLSTSQLKVLVKLNSELVAIERLIESEMTKLISVGKERVDDPDDWVQDFEVDSDINFILSKNDSAFNGYEDNILVQLTAYRNKLISPSEIFSNKVNHNEYQYWDGHVMQDENHCWLYHCLYDHTDLGWSNILRIGYIDIDIKIVYQKHTIRV